MRDKRRLKWVIGLLVVAAAFVWFRKRKAAAELANEIPPETAQVTRGEIRQTVVASGVIEPETTVEVKSNAGGEVTKLFVDIGDQVKAGDILARIDPEDSLTAVRTAGADLRSAHAGVRQAQASAVIERESYPARLRNSQESVRSADARVRQASENLSVARTTAAADVTAADESVRSAQAVLARTELGRERDDAQLTLIIADAEQAEIQAAAQQAEARANLDYQSENYESDLENANQALASAEARLRVARVEAETRPANAAAAVSSARESLEVSRQQLARLESATLPSDAAGVRGEFEAARVQLVNADSDLKRQRELYDKGFVPLATVEAAEATRASAQSRYDVAEQSLKTLDTSQRTELEEARSAVRRAQATLDQAVTTQRDAATADDDLRAAEASVAQARAQVRSAEAGKLQIQVRERELESATAALRRAESARRQAEARRVEPAIRGHQLTEADASARQARAQREQALANRRNVAIREAELDSARAALEQARASLRQTQAERLQGDERAAAVSQAQAGIARSEAELSNAEEALRDTTIIAPRDGVVIEKFVEEGTIITSGRSSVTEGTTIFTLADVTKLYCNAEVDEADVAKVEPNMKATLTVEAYGDETFNAEVRKVYPQGVTESDVTLFTVELEVLRTDKLLRPGMTTEIEIETLIKQNVLTVPAEAVREGPKGFVVMIDKGPDAEPEEVPVQVGIQTFDAVEILSGLNEGMTVITAMGGPAEEEGEGNGGGGGGGSSGRNSPQRQLQRGMRGLGGPPR